jgi:two-component system chemotaxis sensor kinase CheA
LQGRSFLDILSASFLPKDLELVKDYFDMVRTRTLDKATLEDINPLKELSYKSISKGAEKILSCIFSTVERGGGELFLLGSILDITTEKKLQKQLAEEERKQQDEMRTLFDVFKVEPRVMKDFLEDADYEFNRAREILKNASLSPQQSLTDIYQCIHAIKSNAVILGLENFGNKLHDLESIIKEGSVSPVSAGVEKMAREKEKLEDTIQKISSFETREEKIRDHYVLVETLSRAAAKASEDLGKKAQFVVTGIDPGALEKGPRRLMKEVLLQLVRNAVFHGIENPDERAGKNPTGTIDLTIKLEEKQITITLKDDGRGLDFERIRSKAAELRLLKNKEDAEDKKLLADIIFTPGFSTADTAGAHAGRGIGLSLVRDRLKEIQGSIGVQTEPGKGASFNVLIPLQN